MCIISICRVLWLGRLGTLRVFRAFLSIYLPIHLSYLYISISLYLSDCVGKDASAGHQGEGEGEERALPEAEGDRQNRAIKDQREGEFQSINL